MDPTNKLKNKLAQTLRDIKIQGGLNDHIYRKLYPTSMVALNLWPAQNTQNYNLPQAHCFQFALTLQSDSQ